MKPLIAAVASSLLALTPALSEGAARPAPLTQAERQARACALGRTIVDEWRSGSLPYLRRLDDAPVKHDPTVLNSPSPFETLWLEAGPSNLFVACPELRARVGQDSFPTAQERQLAREIPGSRFITIDSYTAPFLDSAGTSALVQNTSVCPGLCGSGWTKLYELKGGRWVETKTFGLWVS